MNAADKLFIIGELERATGYHFSDLRNMSNEKLEAMYWERVMHQPKPEANPKKRGKR